MPDPCTVLHWTDYTYELPEFFQNQKHLTVPVQQYLLYRSAAAVSPTILPTARMIPAKIPGIADGSTILNTVRSFPAPSPKLPSLKESGTAFNASSVVLMISGRIMIASVNAPASRENPHPNVLTKNSIPNNPYTMEGIPESVSVVRRITSTNLFPFPAYSTREDRREDSKRNRDQQRKQRHDNRIDQSRHQRGILRCIF